MTTTTSTNEAGTKADVHGPVDYVLIEFPRDRLTGEAAPALVDLVDRGLIRVMDLLVISKDEDGAVEAVAITDPRGEAAEFEYFAGSRSGLLQDDDMREAAAAMQDNTLAALVVYENTWAIPFVGAVRNSGGELIASARIPAPDVMAVLDSLETND